MAVVLGLLAAISYGTADFLGGLATKRNPAIRVALVSQSVGFGVYLVALPLLSDGRFTAEAWVWGAAAGMTGGLGLAFLYRGLAQGRMSVVAPLTAIVAAVIPVGFGLLTGERPSGLQLLGIALAIPAIALVSSVPHVSANPGPVQATTLRSRLSSLGVGDALVSGLGIGLFLVTITRPGEGAGPYPLVAARIASVSMFLALVLLTRVRFRLAPGTGVVVAASGVIDVMANLLFLLGTYGGLLSVVAVLTSLYPAATVVLARVVVKERLSIHQLVGLGLALAGVASMAAG